MTLNPSMDGLQEINQVFFDNVRVPVANRIGEEGKGWTYAKYLLEFERGGNPYLETLDDFVEGLGNALGVEGHAVGYFELVHNLVDGFVGRSGDFPDPRRPVLAAGHQ